MTGKIKVLLPSGTKIFSFNSGGRISTTSQSGRKREVFSWVQKGAGSNTEVKSVSGYSSTITRFCMALCLTNGDQWKEGHAVIVIHVFSSNVVASVNGVYPRCEGELRSFE